MDNFVPIVGGMFSDTVDTLVGCSLVVHNAVGVLGLVLLLSALLRKLRLLLRMQLLISMSPATASLRSLFPRITTLLSTSSPRRHN